MTELDMHFSIPSTKEECNKVFKEGKAEYTKLANDHLSVHLAELDKLANYVHGSAEKGYYATRKSLINFDNYAASCYGRIIPACASLLSLSHLSTRECSRKPKTNCREHQLAYLRTTSLTATHF
jgi:hypothetical protein